MFLLKDIADYLNGELVGQENLEIHNNLTINSKEKILDGIFIAISGVRFNGHEFIEEAFTNGAIAAVVEDRGALKGKNGIVVKNSRRAFSQLCALFNDSPSKKMSVIGITGTNGKTTIHWLIYQLLLAAKKSAIRIGTIGYEGPKMFSKESLTTPDPFYLNKWLKEALDNGAKYAVMECSSHALSQQRVADVAFKVAVFTNLTRDHLDYHKTMENYFLAKQELFKLITKNGWAVINVDDEYGARLAKNINDKHLVTYGCNSQASWRITEFKQDTTGLSLVLVIEGKSYQVNSKLIGLHNAYNIVAAIAACVGVGLNIEDVIEALKSIQAVCGRLEAAGTNDFGIYVDYAHTPDALEHALETLGELPHKKIWVVFGCGGDRDKGKRPQMAAVAEKLADEIVITSDNPRTEDPRTIIADISTGFSGAKSFSVEVDRAKAIRLCLEQLEKGDLVLIAGKGHEDYQIIGTEKHHFSDQEEVRKFFS